MSFPRPPQPAGAARRLCETPWAKSKSKYVTSTMLNLNLFKKQPTKACEGIKSICAVHLWPCLLCIEIPIWIHGFMPRPKVPSFSTLSHQPQAPGPRCLPGLNRDFAYYAPVFRSLQVKHSWLQKIAVRRDSVGNAYSDLSTLVRFGEGPKALQDLEAVQCTS